MFKEMVKAPAFPCGDVSMAFVVCPINAWPDGLKIFVLIRVESVFFCAFMQPRDLDELSQPGDGCAVIGTQEEVDRRIDGGIE